MAEETAKSAAGRGRGGGGGLDRWGWVLFVVLGLVFFWQVLLGWGGTDRYFWDDFLEHTYPRRHFAGASLAAGEIPFWAPYVFGGMPFLADIESAIFYPPNLALTAFVRGGHLSLRVVEALAVAQLVLAGIWMHLLAGRLGVSRWGAWVSGAVFMLSGFLVTHVIHLPILEVAVWLPLGFLCFHVALSRGSLLYAFVAGAVLAVSFLGGSPQISLLCYLALALFTLWLAAQKVGHAGTFSPGWLRVPALAALAVGFSIGLSALQLLPSYELSQLSVRPQLTYEQSVECSFPLQNLLTFFMPRLFGDTAGGDFGSYWGVGRYFFYWELCGYVGVVSLLLAWVGLRRSHRPYRVFFAVLAGLALLVAAGKYGGLHRLLFAVVPGYDRFRVPTRALLLFAMGASALAGYGADVLAGRVREDLGSWLGRLAWRWAILSTGVFLVGVLVFWKTGYGRRLASGAVLDWGYFAGRAAPFAVFASAGAALCVIRARALISGRTAGGLALVLVVADLFVFGYSHNLGATPPETYYPSGRVLDVLRPAEGEPLFRVQTRAPSGGLLIRRNQGLIDGVFNVDGYNQLKLSLYQTFQVDRDLKLDLLNTRYRVEPGAEGGGFNVVESTTYLPRVWVVPEALVARSPEDALEIMRREDFDPRRRVVLEEAPPWKGDAACTPSECRAAIVSYGSNRIEVEAALDGRGFVVFSEVYYPGWVARVDGEEKPVLRADYALRAVALGPGSHRVEMVYESRSFRRGVLLSGVCLAAGLGIVVAGGLGAKV